MFDINEYYFYKVALVKNITKAAEEIHISQSGLSKAMNKLEEKMGCQLIHRNKRGVELTLAGQILFDGVKQSMDIMEKTTEQISRISYSDYGEVTIGSGDDLFSYFMIPIILDYHHIYPNIILKETLYSNSDRIISGLLNKDIDIGLLNKKTDHDKLEFIKICDMHEVVVAGDKYAALAKVSPLDWKALTEFPMIMHCKNTHTRKFLDQKLEEMGVVLNPAMEVGTTASMIYLALQNVGLALLTREIAQMDERFSKLTEIPMITPLPSRETYVAWNKETTPTPCISNLIKCILERTNEGSSDNI